jgi:hypothetical protein
VSELERDLGTTTTDLATADRQFSQVTNQLQVVSEEATQLRKSNAKLSQDLEGELSVRNVVPTLTSNKRQGLSLNGRCQAIRDRVYPGSGRGPYVQQWCSRGTILLSTGVPVVGLLQARRERKRGLQVPGEMAEDIVGELESKCMVCRVLLFLVVLFCLSPAAGEFAFLL